MNKLTKQPTKAVTRITSPDDHEDELSRHFFVRHPFLLPVSIFVVLFFLGMALYVSLSGQTVGPDDKRIVEVFYDGKSQVVPTRAKTVGDLLQRLNIPMNTKDVVEPAAETPIIDDNFTVNVYRARRVEVIDGAVKTIVQSATRSANALAREAGLTLLPEDLAHFESPNESLSGPIVAEKLVVERSMPVNVSLYGNLMAYRTRAKTMRSFLQEKNINLKSGETTQPADLDAPLVSGQLLSINLPGRQVVSTEESIAFTVTVKNNPTVAAGKERVVQAGATGKKAVLYEIESKDGVEVARRALQSVVLAQPQEEVRERGTMAAATYSVSDDKAAIMSAAGIDASQYAAVDYIITHESHWRPGAINARGCIGLGQRCPVSGNNPLAAACPNWQTDPVCQLQQFNAYAVGRYGSWQGAYQAWQVQGWW